MLTDAQREELEATGLTRVPGVIDRAQAAAIEDRVWDQLERRDHRRDDRATWPTGFTTKNQGMRQARLFDAFDTATTRGIVTDLLGDHQWSTDTGWGQALLSFPQPGTWAVGHQGWHLDLPAKGDPDAVDAARLFGFVVEVVPRGGATLVVEGSHPLLRRMVAEAPTADGSSRRVRRRLAARHPWFRTLFTAVEGEAAADRQAELLAGTTIDGVRVRVRELTGEPGDVVVMLPWTLHSIAHHGGDRLRIIANHTTYRKGAACFEGG